MKIRRLLVAATAASVAFTMTSLLPAGHAAITVPGTVATLGRLVPFGCNHPLSPSQASCFGYALTRAHASSSGPSGYGPADIEKAYNVPAAVAAGTTVAVVDAYDDPNAESDLGVYRQQFGLPPCTTASGCFKKLNQAGVQGSYPQTNTGWAQEISLDLDAVSATCPKCRIVLVEASSQNAADFDKAMDVAAANGAQAISNSYGFAEQQSQLTNDDPHYNHPGVTASTGDSGYGVSFPSTSRYVIAVGGTTLTANSTPRGFSETAWSGAGSGCSAFEPKPSWQIDKACAKRTVADVSAVADPNTGLAVYDTYVSSNLLGPLSLNPPSTGWIQVGGTSLSAPIVASVYAIAHNGAGPSLPYIHRSSLYDVTSGSNCSTGLLGLFGSNCPGNYLDTAGAGYDGPTGLGTPNGVGAF